MEKTYTNLVVLGGGTGIHPVIIASRELLINTTAIVAISDSGGSSGILRNLYHQPAVGDLRQAISGMCDPASKPGLEQLLEYRFTEGEGLRGHTVGNLILTALHNLTGSTHQAAQQCLKLFDVPGQVVPVSETVTDLEITYTDGTTAIGEHILNQRVAEPKKIAHISFTVPPVLNPAAAAAIAEADLLVIGPGDYYDSILATLLVPGMSQALAKTQGRLVYVLNLMSNHTTTDGMTASDYVTGIEQVIGRQVMNIISNSQLIPAAVKKLYAAEDSFPVVDDLGDDQRVIRAPLLAEELHTQNPVDAVKRSALRHSSQKLISILKPLT